MNERVLIDAGPLIAIFNNKDSKHKKIINFLETSRYRFISTLAVYAEVSHHFKKNHDCRQRFFEWVTQRGIILADINQHDIPRISELMKKYSDLPMDLADATLLVTAEKSEIIEIISFDKDFDIYRIFNNKKLENVFYNWLLEN